MKFNFKKIAVFAMLTLLMVGMFSMSVFADEATGNVAGAVEDTWLAARTQIKDFRSKFPRYLLYLYKISKK